MSGIEFEVHAFKGLRQVINISLNSIKYSICQDLCIKEIPLYSVVEDSKFNKSRHKQCIRRSICTRDSVEKMAKLSNPSFKDFSSKGVFLCLIPKEMISQTSVISQSVAF